MPMPQLDEFMQGALELLNHNSRAYVRHKNFKHIYMRVSYRTFDGLKQRMIDLANIAAKRPGEGAFTMLVAELREKYPALGIYVECVQTTRFAEKLRCMDFTEVGDRCFFLSAKQWVRIEPPLCDLCSREATWRCVAGGLRCNTCPKPEL